MKHRTDEGWSAEGARYWREGNHVFQEWYRAARDCDGVWEEGGTLVCHLSQLKARKWADDHDEFLPEWEREEHWQRDHEAERMGY